MTEAAACPHAFDPFDAAYLADPYPTFAALRADQPVFYDGALDMWVVTRHADVEHVFRHPDTFSAAIAQDPLFPLAAEARAVLASGFRPIKTMSNLDGTEHTRIRRHNQVGFSPKRLRAMEPVVREATTDLIDAMVDQSTATGAARHADVVAALSFPLPARIVFALLGFPADDTELLKSWCGDRMSFSWGRPGPAEQVAVARDMVAYWSYCERHIERRLADPHDDFTSDLLAIHRADPTTLSLHEITHVVYGLSFAGHETTTNLISNTLRRVLERPGLWERLRYDHGLVGATVDEGLRHDSSVVTWRRITTEATELGGCALPADAKLLLMLAAANHDPAVFQDPDEFDPERTDAARHLSLGLGKHYCLGAPLAKVEVAVVLHELSRRLPSLALVAGQGLEFHPNVSFRGPRRLLVSW